MPHLLPLEKELFQKNEFRVAFLEMDWRLNDLDAQDERNDGRRVMERAKGAGGHRRDRRA